MSRYCLIFLSALFVSITSPASAMLPDGRNPRETPTAEPSPPHNRLLDIAGNRCGNEQIPPGECPDYQNFAWNGGNGCINWVENEYARANLIAPMCSILDRTRYIGWCRCGCFKKGTNVYVSDKNGPRWASVEELPGKESTFKIFTLGLRSKLGRLVRDVFDIKATTVGAEKKPLVIITTSSGKVLGITETHGVLLANGYMARASELKPSDVLVNMDGTREHIRSIDRAPTEEMVYNMLTSASLDNKPGHLVFAEGLIVGDLYWQNILDSEFRDIAVRK